MCLHLPIRTRRLELRDFRQDDIGAIHAYRSDLHVTRFMFFGPDTIEETRAYMSTVFEAKSAEPRRVWELAVVQASNARVIGGCDLTFEGTDQADLGYILSRGAWSRGYATEIARTLLQRGFLDLGLRRVFATCDRENNASRRVLIKAGLRFESVINRHRYAKNRWWDSELYAITRDDWFARREADA
ncbi:MAG: GNAT family protein [Myxococcota bacterium]|nr:GNAT family protein [Myxococcota bacterium]